MSNKPNLLSRGLCRLAFSLLVVPCTGFGGSGPTGSQVQLLRGLTAGNGGAPLVASDDKLLRSLQPPLSRLLVTSPFGSRLNPVTRSVKFHKGVDYGAPTGTPVYAAQDGVVEVVNVEDHSGIVVRLRHSANVETIYAHLHRVMPGLRAGARLRCGDVLGFVGASGFATGPHLHYEALLRGRPIDPQRRGDGLYVAGLR